MSRRNRRAAASDAGRAAAAGRRRGIAVLLALVAVTLAAYYPAWHGGLLWDDQRAPDRARPAIARRPPPHLARAWRDPAVLPGRPLRLLAAASAVGRLDARLPPRQHPPPRGVGLLRRPRPASPRRPRRVAGGRRLRAPSRARRIGGLDHRAEEHAVRRLLPRRRARLAALRRVAPDSGLTRAPRRALRPRAPQQDGDGDAAGRCSSSSSGGAAGRSTCRRDRCRSLRWSGSARRPAR